jgi:surface antigen
MQRLVAMLLIAAACTSAPARSTGVQVDQNSTGELALYLTESFNGAGLIAVDSVTLQDRSTKPLLAISPTTAKNVWTVASPDGSAIAVMNYQYGNPAAARELDIAVFDARTGMLRKRFNPEVPVIVDALSPDGTRIYARNWPPTDVASERLVLDATNGRILEREPQLAISGDAIARTSDEQSQHLYGLVVPSDPDATGPRSVDLGSWDRRTGKELWRLKLPSLAAGEWKTGRIIGGAEVRSHLAPALALSPDRRQLAIVRAFDCCVPHGTIWLVDANTGTLISERTFARASLLDQLFGPSIASAKSLDESVIVNAIFSPDGETLYIYASKTKVDDQGEPSNQYLGMAAVALRDAAVRGDDIKMEIYWFDNRIEWVRASADGRWLYVFLERTGRAEPKGHYLRRLDPSTLRLLAERRFDAYREPFMLATR